MAQDRATPISDIDAPSLIGFVKLFCLIQQLITHVTWNCVNQRLCFRVLSVHRIEEVRFQESENTIDAKFIDEVEARPAEMVFVLEKSNFVATS